MDGELPLGSRRPGLLARLHTPRLGEINRSPGGYGEEVTAYFDRDTNAWFLRSEVRTIDPVALTTKYFHVRVNPDGSMNHEETSAELPSEALLEAHQATEARGSYKTIPGMERHVDGATTIWRMTVSVNLRRGCIWVDMAPDYAGRCAGTMELPIGRDKSGVPVLGNPSGWTRASYWEQARARYDPQSGSWYIRCEGTITGPDSGHVEKFCHVRVDRDGKITAERYDSETPSSQLKCGLRDVK